VVVGDTEKVIDGLVAALLHHRFPRRSVAAVPA
jgi:hypothetical protein